MAKRLKIAQVSASFHYLVKQMKGEQDPADLGFSAADFSRIVERIKNTKSINLKDDQEISSIKLGRNLPFIKHEQLDEFQHFGRFEGAYYGHEFRNSKAGKIEADSLNLRPFYYLLDLRRDGKIVVGVQYSGLYGDYDGLKRCLQTILEGPDINVISRTFCSPRHEIGNGDPVELKVNIRKQSSQLGGASLFSKTGVFAIRKSDYGDGFKDDIKRRLTPILGRGLSDKKKQLAALISEGDILDISDEDIESCTLLMRSNGSTHTVYVLGENSFATKFPISADVDPSGHPKPAQVKAEMLRLLNTVVTPSLRK